MIDQTNPEQSRDAANWAKPVSELKTSNVPTHAMNLNVNGRQLTGPVKGFGQLWQKVYKVRLSGVALALGEVIRTWKENFAEFWPEGNHFYGPLTGIAPGEVALLNLDGPVGMPLSTGVMVIYADEESFTFMTPAGHMFAAWITFSAFEEAGATVAQVQTLMRATDPIMEVGLRLWGHKAEDNFWHQTLKALAAHFGVNGYVQQQSTCLDTRFQWWEAKNVWDNAAIRTFFYAPVHFVRRRMSR